MIPTNVFAVNETEYENQQQNLFTYSFTEPTAEGENGKAVLIGLVDNYKELLGGSTELILPNVYVNAETGVKYNCELNSAKTKFLQENDYITKVTLSNLYKSISGKFCFNATAMKTISFKYSGDKFRFNANSLSSCTSLEKIYVYAESLYNVPLSTVFTNVPVSAIPFPPSGYWTRRKMGKDVSSEIVELPPSDIESVELLLSGVKIKKEKKMVLDKSLLIKENIKKDINSVSKEVIESPVEYDSSTLLFLNKEERFQVLNAAANLVISNKKKLHNQLIKYNNSIIEWKRKEKEAQSRLYYNPKYDKPDNEPTFFNEMSNALKPRAMQILDAVFCAVEKLGGKINEDLSIIIKKDTVRFRLCEGQNKVKHELTRQEARELAEYNDKIKNNKWVAKPQIKKYDYIYNGKLRIVFGEKNYIRDSKSEKLEERLGDILINLYEKSEQLRIDREKHEEELRRQEDEARRKEELRVRKEKEIKRTIELTNQAEDYNIACQIRQYISAVIQEGNIDSEKEKWIEWAKNKADWYDPITALSDEYLGSREHSKSKEEKDLDKLNSNRRFGWSW